VNRPPRHTPATPSDGDAARFAPAVHVLRGGGVRAVATGAITIVVTLATIWLRWPSGSDDGPSPGWVVSSADGDRLDHALPAGFPPGSCTPIDPHHGLAAVSCTANEDQGGPVSALFVLNRDHQGLATGFREAVTDERGVDCPSGTRSPGPWRRASDPRSAGTVFCGLGRGRTTVAWTDDAANLLGVAHGEGTEANLRRLYAWWSTHS
jgi:hypothetical protein